MTRRIKCLMEVKDYLFSRKMYQDIQKSKCKIAHQGCSLPGHILNLEVKPSTFLFDLMSAWSQVLTPTVSLWRHYGVEGGLGEEQDP